jgi:pentachlorophenol monooxygenase
VLTLRASRAPHRFSSSLRRAFARAWAIVPESSMDTHSISRLRDVVIAGAGPVGLFLSCELALAGLDVLVVERDEHPAAPLKSGPLGTRGLSIATAETLHRRGLLEALLAAGAVRAPQAGHFASIAIDAAKVDRAAWPHHLPGPADTPLACDLATLEAVLAARAVALGVEIRRCAAVIGLDERADEVLVRAGDTGLRARWLVGCDGGRSAVRKLAGFEFAGTEPEFTAYSALVDIADPERLKPGRHATPTGFYMNQPGRIAVADFDGGAYDRGRPVTREHLQAVLRRVSGTDVTLSALHLATTFTDRARLATRYRRGRVLLAGDAAHVHSALGGQGLNAGLGDAMNLGWKLAATVRGRAPDGLLDTYEAERRPVGQWLLDWTRAQVALMRPDAHARALEGLVRELAATRDGATHFAGQLWGVALRHELGVDHPLAGRSAPELAFDDGRRLGDQLRDGRGVLVDLAGSEAVRRAVLPWDGRVRLVTASVREPLGLGALLVRPDGIVAWAIDDGAAADGLLPALARWFGAAQS